MTVLPISSLSPSSTAPRRHPEPASLISICPWPKDKRWVYSITFDEALADLHRFVIPILAQHNVPGHLEVVVGQLGQIRQVGASSYNGQRHMNADELKEMLDRGWGVGNHSWAHMDVNAQTAELNLRQAKQVLEDAIDSPVTVYCSPNDNGNLNPEVLERLPGYGYLAGMSLTDALNRPGDVDLLWLNRTFLHTRGYAPFYSEFDPFRNIQHAKRDQGWLIDYLHCPLEKAVHENKDCSAAQLQERIETVISEGGDDVWLARVEDAIDYRYTRRHTVIESLGEHHFSLSAPNVPAAVARRTVTVSLPGTARGVEVNGRCVKTIRRGDHQLLQVDLSRPQPIKLAY